MRVFAYDGNGQIISRRDGTASGSTIDQGNDPGLRNQHYVYVGGQQVAHYDEKATLDVLSQVTAFSSGNGTGDYVVQQGRHAQEHRADGLRQRKPVVHRGAGERAQRRRGPGGGLEPVDPVGDDDQERRHNVQAVQPERDPEQYHIGPACDRTVPTAVPPPELTFAAR